MLFKDLEVRKILTDYNESLGESAELDVEKVCGALTKAGGGVEAVAKELSYEEITKAGVPPAVARAIAVVWRASRVEEKPVAKPDMPEVQVGGVEGTFKGLALAIGNVTAFGDKELIEIYEPLGAANVMAELLVRSERKPFIVFKNKQTRQVDVESSFDNLQLIKQGVDIGNRAIIAGNLTELFKAGEVPDLALQICPVHDCYLIGEGQFCQKCSFSWSGVTTEVRELVWCHVQNVLGEVPDSQDARLKQIHAALVNPKDQYWSAAALELEKLKATGQPIVLIRPVKRNASPATSSRL